MGEILSFEGKVMFAAKEKENRLFEEKHLFCDFLYGLDFEKIFFY